MGEPRLVAGGLAGSGGEIEDALLPEAGIRAGSRIHALPEPQALDGEGDLGGVSSHLAAPAPVPTGLLAADVAFLAQGHRNSPLGKRQGSACADNAAADNHDVDFGGKIGG